MNRIIIILSLPFIIGWFIVFLVGMIFSNKKSEQGAEDLAKMYQDISNQAKQWVKECVKDW